MGSSDVKVLKNGVVAVFIPTRSGGRHLVSAHPNQHLEDGGRLLEDEFSSEVADIRGTVDWGLKGKPQDFGGS